MDVHKGGGDLAHVDRGGGSKIRFFFVDVINGWPPLIKRCGFLNILRIIFNFSAEYRGLTCEDIPYRKFGFSSAKEFILKMAPDAAKLST